MSIRYSSTSKVTTEQFIELLHSSTLGERRPVDDPECIEGMVDNSNLIVSAWDGEKLVGIARSVTDFHYACYLSDLAVDQKYKNSGIGKKLISLTQKRLGPKCKLLLIAAPAANSYYEKIGFNNNPRCWILEPDQTIRN
jgi:ribosomal protein S18 acetylase RimI-like enzyme